MAINPNEINIKNIIELIQSSSINDNDLLVIGQGIYARKSTVLELYNKFGVPSILTSLNSLQLQINQLNNTVGNSVLYSPQVKTPQQRADARGNLDVYSRSETQTVVNSAIVNLGNVVNSVTNVNPALVDNTDPKNPVIAEFREISDYNNDMLLKADIDGNLTIGGVWFQDQVLSDRFANYKQVWTALTNNTIEWGNIELDKHIFLVDDVDGLKVKVGGTEGAIWNEFNFNPDSKVNLNGNNATGILLDAINLRHSHANKSILDAITAPYTTAEQSKLLGIQAGAEVNVNADWNATSGDAEILNKPATFPPSAHTHPISDIIGLQAELNAKLEEADLDGFIYDVQYNSTTHEITFYSQNEPNIVIDLPIEQLIKGVQLVGDDLVFTFEDGSTVTVPMNTLLVGVVKSVNGLTPNSQGEIVLQITDIPGLSSELANKLDIRMAGLVNNLTQPEKDAILTKLGVVNNIVQVLGLSGNTITLSNGGGSISLNIANIGGLQTELNKIGNLPSLTTTDKSNLVGAINEVNEKTTSSIWSYSVSASTSNRITLRYSDGTSFTSTTDDGLYEINLHTIGTGTVTGSKYILRRVSNSWVIRVIRESGTSSNHPMLEIDANGIPVVYTNHTSTYTIMVNVRKYDVAFGSSTVNDITFLGLDYESIIGTPTIPTDSDFITTNTNQTGLSGNKTTDGLWIFSPAPTTSARFEYTPYDNVASGIRLDNYNVGGVKRYADFAINAELSIAGIGFGTVGGNLPNGSTTTANFGMWVDGANNLFSGRNIYANNGIVESLNGFSKTGATNADVLLGSGGHRPVSDFALAGSLGSYVAKSGDTMSGSLNFTTDNMLSHNNVNKFYSDSTSTVISSNGATWNAGGVFFRPSTFNDNSNQWSFRGAGNLEMPTSGAGYIARTSNLSRTFNKVYQNYTQAASTGILSIKFPQVTTGATMIDVTIKFHSYSLAALAELRVSFYRQANNIIHVSNGLRALLTKTSTFPTEIVSVGIDANGMVCINIGEPTTAWASYSSFEVERVETKYIGYNNDWGSGWTSEFETSTSGYTILHTVPVDVLKSSDNYLPLAGGTMTGAIDFNIQLALNYLGQNRIHFGTNSTVISGNASTGSANGVFFRPINGSAINEVTIDGNGQINTTNHGNSSQWKQAYDAIATIPSAANNGLLTISTSSDLTGGGTFSADQATASDVNIGLSSGTLSSLELADSALQSGDNVSELANDAGYITASSLPNVGNGDITYSGIGDITGGGTSTANQSGNTDYTFDLTAQTKSNISLGVTANSWGNHSGLYPLLSGSYANPTWISSLDWDKITNKPTIPTSSDYITTSTTQTGLSGDKETTGKWTYNGLGNRTIYAINTNTSISNNVGFVEIDNNSQNTNMFIGNAFLVKTNNIQGFRVNGFGDVYTERGFFATNGFSKTGQNDTQMLLAGGGHRPVSDFALAGSLNGFVPISRILTINGTTFDLSQNRTWTIPDNDTITRLRGTTSGTYTSGDLTLLEGTGIGISQSGSNLTITNSAPNATHTGDVTGSTALTIANGVVTNTKLANMPANTFKGRLSSAGVPQDLTVTQMQSVLGITTVNDGTFQVQGVGSLTGSGSTSANASANTTADLDLTAAEKNRIQQGVDANAQIPALIEGVDFHHVSTTAGYTVNITQKKTIVNVASGLLNAEIYIDEAPYIGYELAINGCGEWSAYLNGAIRDSCLDEDRIIVADISRLFWWDGTVWVQAI